MAIVIESINLLEFFKAETVPLQAVGTGFNGVDTAAPSGMITSTDPDLPVSSPQVLAAITFDALTGKFTATFNLTPDWDSGFEANFMGNLTITLIDQTPPPSSGTKTFAVTYKTRESAKQRAG